MFSKSLFRFIGSRATQPQLPSNLPPMTSQPVSSSSHSSSSSFTHDSSWTYDVFLSFRGEDTRTNFTDHLHNALVGKGIHTFIDDDELPRGEEIAPALLKAIEDSRISLIVFSENYASSRWCLDELVEILRCKESKQQIVLPIFYKVDPSHVRNQTSKFGDAFEGLIESKFKDNEEKVLIWREALTKAANLSGHPFKDGEYEATFINDIIDEIISRVLSCTYWNVAKHPVGIQSCVRDVERLLDVGGNDRRMVGIWGTSGIGKTTIAKAIWNAIAHKFEGSCFLSNVRDNSMSDGDLIKLQEALLHQILGGEWKIRNVDEGIGVIKERLSCKKILLILDDVNQLKQLDNLAGVGWFGEGSRVITTTQDSGLLKCHGIDLIYEVKKLYGNRALELFSFSAFGTNEPPKDYLELAQRALAYAQGIPLALTLLGSHLRNKDRDRWQDILDSYEGEPYTGIQKILRKSYDALENSVQQVFLDIACFFKGENKNYVLQIVSNSKNKVSRDCIGVLIEKAMITTEWGGTIWMHDLLEKLGKDIVHEESPNDPGKRSRLWLYEDVEQVLTDSTGTRKIKGIIVKLPEPAEIILNPECFCNMVNLEIFINRNASLRGHINYLPNALRLIDWDRCQLQSLPPNFQGNRLVEFKMPDSHIRQLEVFKHLPNLTSMNLSGCQFLEKIPDLSGIPNIKYLHLIECTSLVEVDDSVGFLDKLVHLNLGGCVKLTRFGTRLRLKSLEILDLSYCKMLESFPEIEVEMESLETLDISESGIRELPDLSGIPNIKYLHLRGCKKLESFPEIEVEMESLRQLHISRSGVRELPSSIVYLTGLRELRADYCENLTQVSSSNSELQLSSYNYDELKFKYDFDFRGCNLSKIDFLLSFDFWSRVTRLDLSENNFVILPICFSKFVNLVTLCLIDCKSLLEIPELVLPRTIESVRLDNCTSLEKIPKMAWVLLEKIPEIDWEYRWPSLELSLVNCVGLRGYDITENIFRNQVLSCPNGIFSILLPGEEIPKWFSYRKVFGHYLNEFRQELNAFGEEEYQARYEVKFEIPPNLKWETSLLVLCVANVFGEEGCYARCDATILVDGDLYPCYNIGEIQPSHVQLLCIRLLKPDGLLEKPPTWLKQSHMCQVDFYAIVPIPVKMACGVHLLGHQVADVVDHGPTQWLPGKRPHESDFMALDNGPADHPKRRHINPDEEPKESN